MSAPQERPSTDTRTPQELTRVLVTDPLPAPTAALVATVTPALFKVALEALGYEATADTPYCWVMRRPGHLPLVIPRLGHTVGTDVVYATLRKLDFEPESLFRLCQLVIEQPAVGDDS